MQNTHYKTLNYVKFPCLWGWTSFFTEARNRSNSEIQESVTIRVQLPNGGVL